MKTFSRVWVALAGLGFLGFGVWLVIDPAGGLAGVGVGARDAAGLIELRAFYGGLELGLGGFLLACTKRRGLRRPGLWLTLASNGGIGAVRLATIALTGVATPFLAIALVWELGFAGVAGWLLSRSKAKGRVASEPAPTKL
ncbi:DUF4345 family protein [Arenimonas oryziterrae]|uniref:DUF4345 domain-containing protein n=1 Tax=Arenimonas oryziterrae DSM 21050 = YC6267 TaxID=1121015 RepID=A0A091AVB5_9GAMM|nr:DUF4345 family protein [Arenimonas oryziterrae]KFN42609.1 hypothetical protein N789_13290 [Arenimonas oryziterrae DSM 21050 = YC6267]